MIVTYASATAVKLRLKRAAEVAVGFPAILVRVC